MTHRSICPYYGINEDWCDIGCGYITPHDVKIIIRYCSSRYEECPKYQELIERFPEVLIS